VGVGVGGRRRKRGGGVVAAVAAQRAVTETTIANRMDYFWESNNQPEMAAATDKAAVEAAFAPWQCSIGQQ